MHAFAFEESGSKTKVDFVFATTQATARHALWLRYRSQFGDWGLFTARLLYLVLKCPVLRLK